MKTYELKATKNKDLFRVVNREGDWEHYFHEPSGRYLRGVTTILKKGYVAGDGLLKFLSQHTERERDEILAAAGERGDKVHRAIDLLTSGEGEMVLSREEGVYNREKEDYEKLENDEWDALLAFGKFWDVHRPIVLAAEQPAFSLVGGYAGTTDAILILTRECSVRTCKCAGLKNKVGLWDYKTSGGIYPNYTAQAAAYSKCDNLKEFLTGKKIAYTAILRIGTTHKTTGGYEIKVEIGPEVKQSFERFESAQIIANHGYKPFDPSEIEEIPDQITIVHTNIKKKAPKKLKEAKQIA